MPLVRVFWPALGSYTEIMAPFLEPEDESAVDLLASLDFDDE
jgi:hypothetical protein